MIGAIRPLSDAIFQQEIAALYSCLNIVYTYGSLAVHTCLKQIEEIENSCLRLLIFLGFVVVVGV